MSKQKTKKENKNKQQIESLKKKIKKLEQLNQEYEDKLLRLKAEFENYKKRMLKEQAQSVKYASENMIYQLLPIVDNLNRALAAIDDKANLEIIIEGVKITQKDISKLLEQNLVKEINPVNEPFNPEEHEAIATVESKDHKDDCVVDVYLKGYKIADKIIRPAKVSICKKKSTSNQEKEQ